jgi:mRNA interferase RelE/StbE
MWQIQINKLVLKEDFKRIDRPIRQLILKTIYKKLSIDPEGYGEKLRYGLKGYWKLKVSDYRVIYRIEKDRVLVLVLKIGLRRDEAVYREMLTRLGKIL